MTTQPPSRLCPTCGVPVASEQRFCSNCGSLISEEANKPTALSGESSQLTSMETVANTPTPPPPPHYDGSPYPPYGSEGRYTPPPPPYQGQVVGQVPPAPPSYATPQRGSSGRVWRRIGCIAGIVLLLVLGICGTGGYFLYRGATTVVNDAQQTATATGGYASSGNTDNGTTTGTATTGSIKTTPVGSTITYASNDVTIVNVQQALSFVDDTYSKLQSSGTARLNFKEQNNASNSASYLYSDIARLILPDGSQAAPLNAQNNISPDASVSRTNWLDFAVPTTADAAKLTLVLGTSNDAQMRIPLTGSADLTTYKPKTVKPNKTLQHEGLNWTVTDATASLSSNATQAKKGMMYVTLTLKVDNPSQTDVSEVWTDFMRLKTGDTTSSPEGASTFPTTFPAGSSGKTGSVAFLVPQGSTSFTFILLANSSGTAPQTTTDFQIQ